MYKRQIYEQILADPDTVVKGTVKELADKYGVEVLLMTGFLDGINDSLKTPNPIETMEEDTEVSLDYDKEKLYYNMVCLLYTSSPNSILCPLCFIWKSFLDEKHISLLSL